MSTLVVYHDECGEIMGTPGGVQFTRGYYDYTRAIHYTRRLS